MAGSIITMPNNGDSDWSSFVTIVEQTIRGYMGVSLSNLAGTGAPQIQDCSVIEIGGSIYQFTTAETITGWPSAAGTTEYIAAVPAGSTVTVIYTTTAPDWSGAKGGWYSGNNRYIGAVEWGGSATYSDKFIYHRYMDNTDALKLYGDGEIDTGSGEITTTGAIAAATITTTGVITAGGVLDSAVGRTPTATLHGSALASTIFNTITPYIPATGDTLVVHGSIYSPVVTDAVPVSYVARTNATTITFYCIKANAATTITLSSGSSTVAISMAW